MTLTTMTKMKNMETKLKMKTVTMQKRTKRVKLRLLKQTHSGFKNSSVSNSNP
jgi:hypothetical protein